MISLPLVKVLSLFAYPIIQVVCLLLLGIFQSLRGRGRRSLVFFFLALFWLWLSSTPFFAGELMARLERDYPPLAAENLPEADVIVLLGGAIRGKVSDDTLADMSGVGDRLIHAVAAYKAGKAPLILVTGGAPDGYDSEAAQIREILVVMGVPFEKIVLEIRNRVTADSRRYLPETLRAIGADSVVLVTSAFHMRRAMWVFDTLDVQVYPAPTDHQVLVPGEFMSVLDFVPNVGALQRTTWAIHEAIGLLYYRMTA